MRSYIDRTRDLPSTIWNFKDSYPWLTTSNLCGMISKGINLPYSTVYNQAKELGL